MKGSDIKNSFRSLFSGLLPLFILAHFFHHVIGALLRPMLPMIRTELGLSYTEVGVLTSAFAITGGIAQLPAGFLADRFGARLMVALGVTGVAVTGLLMGISHSYLMLIMLLVLAALLGGGYHPASATAISLVVPEQARGRALGMHLIGGSSAFWVVPLVATPIAAAWTWRGAYITMSIPTLVLGVILYILIGKQTNSQQTIQQTANAAQAKSPDKIDWSKLMPFLLLSVATGTMLQSVSGYLSLYAVDKLGVTQSAAALLMAVTPALGLFAAPFGGYLSDRFGGVPVMIVVSFVTVPLIYLLGVIATVPAFIAVMVAQGLASNARMPTSESYIIGNIPVKRRSTILGLYFFAGAEISGLMTPFVGKLIDSRGFEETFSITAIISGIITVVCVAFIWFNSRRFKAQRNTQL